MSLALYASGLDMAVGARRTRSMVYHFDGAAWVQRGSSHTELISSGLAFLIKIPLPSQMTEHTML